MGNLGVIEILYIIFLIGSFAFGLEAMLLGLGGKLMVLYRRTKKRTFALALVTGLAVVIPAIFTSIVLGLGPLYFSALVIVYAFVAGKIINVFGSRRIRPPPMPPIQKISDEEIEAAVRKRGLDKLVSKKRRLKTISKNK